MPADAVTPRQLAEVRRVLSRIRAEARRRPDYGFDKPWDEFVSLMSVLHPQSYGGRIGRYIADKLGWAAVGAREDRGDATDGRLYYEIKTTLITETNRSANFVQIRPHQDVDRYVCVVADVRDGAPRTAIYVLSHGQMLDELGKAGTSAHGTRAAVADNKTREWAVRFRWRAGDPTKDRWDSEYLDGEILRRITGD